MAASCTTLRHLGPAETAGGHASPSAAAHCVVRSALPCWPRRKGRGRQQVLRPNDAAAVHSIGMRYCLCRTRDPLLGTHRAFRTSPVERTRLHIPSEADGQLQCERCCTALEAPWAQRWALASVALEKPSSRVRLPAQEHPFQHAAECVGTPLLQSWTTCLQDTWRSLCHFDIVLRIARRRTASSYCLQQTAARDQGGNACMTPTQAGRSGRRGRRHHKVACSPLRARSVLGRNQNKRCDWRC